MAAATAVPTLYERFMAGNRRAPTLSSCGTLSKAIEKELKLVEDMVRMYYCYPKVMAQLAAVKDWLSAQPKDTQTPCFRRKSSNTKVFMRTPEGAMVPVYFTAPKWALLCTYDGPTELVGGTPYGSERPEWGYIKPVPEDADIWYTSATGGLVRL